MAGSFDDGSHHPYHPYSCPFLNPSLGVWKHKETHLWLVEYGQTEGMSLARLCKERSSDSCPAFSFACSSGNQLPCRELFYHQPEWQGAGERAPANMGGEQGLPCNYPWVELNSGPCSFLNFFLAEFQIFLKCNLGNSCEVLQRLHGILLVEIGHRGRLAFLLHRTLTDTGVPLSSSSQCAASPGAARPCPAGMPQPTFLKTLRSMKLHEAILYQTKAHRLSKKGVAM